MCAGPQGNFWWPQQFPVCSPIADLTGKNHFMHWLCNVSVQWHICSKNPTLTACKLLCWHIPHSAGKSVHLSNWDWQNKRKENIKKQTFNHVWATKHKLLTEVTAQRMLKSSLHMQRQGVKSPEQKHSTASVSNCKEAQSSCRKALAPLTTWNTVLPCWEAHAEFSPCQLCGDTR